jgi:hypothetical protein
MGLIAAGKPEATSLHLPKRHTMMGTGENANKPVTYELVKEAFNCSEETVSVSK